MITLPYIDRIWTARGHIDLDPPASASKTFARLEPLLDASGTTVTIDGATLAYVKDNPAAQDQLATFSRGELEVSEADGRPRLHYRLVSPALLLVFLAPLFFLAIAQATVLVSELERPSAAEKAKMEKEKAEKEKEAEKEDPAELNPVDQWLGAPQPETLEEKKQRELEQKKDKDEDAKHSPKPAYVLAAIFAALYLVGRWLEPFLLRRRLRKVLLGDAAGDPAASAGLTAEPPAR